jgi:tRNA U34 2-thiouridine synthase MnmA/TrmU
MKALALMSGGLDSTLAAVLVKEQGIDVEGINFHTGFCSCSDKL